MNIYIDESGSMTHDTSIKKNENFIISLVLVENPDKLRRIYKRFVQKYYNELKNIDTENKMFNGNTFIELKGSAFTPEMKRNFVYFFCKNNFFKVLYIMIDNTKTSANLYKNKARAFNYVLKLALEYLHNKSILIDSHWILHVDERNVKTETKYQLEEFLNTEFVAGKDITDDISVTYFDSCNNKLIQIADVLSNILYSNILTNGNYNDEIIDMIDDEYLISIFKFPLT